MKAAGGRDGAGTATPGRSPTRSRLLAAAAELIGEGGYAAASVVAIAERAGLSAGALYRHFPSKVDLFRELFETSADELLAAMRAAGAGKETNLERLDAVLETYAAQVLDNRRLSWALVYEPVAPELDADRLEYRRRYRAGMAELLRAAIAAGELPEQDPELSAAAVVGAMSEALLNLASPTSPGGHGDAQLTAGVIAICRRAVGAPAD
jgi:AcrR family transcriptional regulator